MNIYIYLYLYAIKFQKREIISNRKNLRKFYKEHDNLNA